jgi:hypothetical protein
MRLQRVNICMILVQQKKESLCHYWQMTALDAVILGTNVTEKQ